MTIRVTRLKRVQLDSLKSRLQTHKGSSISIPKLASIVYREEGFGGFFRGLWIPLVTISVVRMLPYSCPRFQVI
jgi:solute carrier family 25 carnitine/acylcarnitine transporter 20/29